MKVFVFGSNLAGLHGAGAAKYARDNHGAEYGVGVGPTGQSYALPTKDHQIRTMSVTAIHAYINEFIKHARNHPDQIFQVTRIGCGLAGHRDEDIAPMFRSAPKNCEFDSAWKAWIGDHHDYWGHVS